MSEVKHVHEAPVFRQLDKCSFSYAFEIAAPPDWDSARDVFAAGKDRCAFRLRHLEDAIRKDNPETYDQLIDPVRSFLADVTTGPPGTNGRPLMFGASGAATDHKGRIVWLMRNATWDYEYEGDRTVLTVDPERARIPMRVRDSFSVFESGRIFYVLTLTQAEDLGPALDEYGVIQLQQLAMETAKAGKSGYLDFEWDADFEFGGGTARKGGTLIDLANARLAAGTSADDAGPRSGVQHVLRRFDLLKTKPAPRVSGKELRRLCIAIEDDRLLDVADLADKYYGAMEATGVVAGAADPAERLEAAAHVIARAAEALRAGHGAAERLDEAAALLRKPAEATAARAKLETGAGKDWLATHGMHDEDGPRRHRGDEEGVDRAMLAFAGIAQGVPDFPNQDDSEVHDSTRPTASSVESKVYSHPRFTLEVAKNWRSYDRARPYLGTCPYLLLTFLVTTHDELIVADMEARLERMLFDIADHRERGSVIAGARSSPLADVRGVLSHATNPLSGHIHILNTNLKSRFELFRWGSIHRSGNIFRYPKEKAALDAIHKAMATSERFDEAHALIDRMESIVEDASTLKSAYAQSVTNFILFSLALLGILGASKDVSEIMAKYPWLPHPDILQTSLILIAGLVALMLLHWGPSWLVRRVTAGWRWYLRRKLVTRVAIAAGAVAIVFGLVFLA